MHDFRSERSGQMGGKRDLQTLLLKASCFTVLLLLLWATPVVKSQSEAIPKLNNWSTICLQFHPEDHSTWGCPFPLHLQLSFSKTICFQLSCWQLAGFVLWESLTQWCWDTRKLTTCVVFLQAFGAQPVCVRLSPALVVGVPAQPPDRDERSALRGAAPHAAQEDRPDPRLQVQV